MLTIARRLAFFVQVKMLVTLHLQMIQSFHEYSDKESLLVYSNLP